MTFNAWAERGPDETTDDELDAAEADLADAIEEQADRYRKGEW